MYGCIDISVNPLYLIIVSKSIYRLLEFLLDESLVDLICKGIINFWDRVEVSIWLVPSLDNLSGSTGRILAISLSNWPVKSELELNNFVPSGVNLTDPEKSSK